MQYNNIIKNLFKNQRTSTGQQVQETIQKTMVHIADLLLGNILLFRKLIMIISRRIFLI